MKKNIDFIKEASSSRQYDNPKNIWINNANTPLVTIFWSHLKKYRKNWENANIIDIGCGTGWLIHSIDKLKIAKKIIGLEPSKKNFKKAKELNPGLNIFNQTFYEFQPDIQFDILFVIMTIQHIRGLDKFFKKIHKILNKNGFLHIIAPDYDYFSSKRYNYQVQLKNINKNVVVVHTFRPKYGHFFDIIRKLDVYKISAEKSGLTLIKEEGISISKSLANKEKKYRDLINKNISHHLIFKKI